MAMLDMTMRKEFEALGDRSAAETITLLRHSADFSDRRLLADELRIKFVFATVDLYNLTDQLRPKLDLVKTGAREIRLLRHDWDEDKLREEAAIEKAARKNSPAGDAPGESGGESGSEPAVTLENLEAAARDLSRGVAEMKAELLKKLNGEKVASEENHTGSALPLDGGGIQGEGAGDTRTPTVASGDTGGDTSPLQGEEGSREGSPFPPHSQSHRAGQSPQVFEGSARRRPRGSRRLG